VALGELPDALSHQTSGRYKREGAGSKREPHLVETRLRMGLVFMFMDLGR